MLAKCRDGIMLKDNKELIYKLCQSTIYNARVPTLSVYNTVGLVEQSPELNLCPMEERHGSLIWDLPCGGQKLVHGNTVNVLPKV